MPHRYVLAIFLPSGFPLQNFIPHGYQPMHNSREHVQGAQRFDVSAHLDINNDLVSFVLDWGPVVKLYTAAMSNSSEEPDVTKTDKNLLEQLVTYVRTYVHTHVTTCRYVGSTSDYLVSESIVLCRRS